MSNVNEGSKYPTPKIEIGLDGLDGFDKMNQSSISGIDEQEVS